MKKLMIAFLLMYSVLTYAKQISTYKASNNKTYHIGDSITMWRGSGINCTFAYIVNDLNTKPVKSFYAGRVVEAYNIKETNSGKVIIQVLCGKLGSFNIYIEDAIATCEIVYCKKDAIPVTIVPSKYDELKKLKELLDSGAITEDEYKKEKEKLLVK